MNDVDQYINKFDKKTADQLNEIRELVASLAPSATERICMGIPTFDLNGKWLVHYAAFKKHIGFYPDPDTIAAFQNDLKPYQTSKGTVKFLLDQPLPMDLIRKMTEYRIQQLKKQISQK